MKRGVTLIELIVSLSLVFAVIMFVLNLFPTSLVGMRHSETRLFAQDLAEQTLETTLAGGFTQMVVSSATALPAVHQHGYSFQQTVAIFAVPGWPSADLKGVRVTVQWYDHDHTRTYVKEIWRARGG